MKISIIGGSHGTGALLAALARDAGHEVTVLSRSGTAPDGVRVFAGNRSDPTAAREAVMGSDVVVVTVGGAKGVRHQRASVTRAVVDAMRLTGTRRLVVQSSLGGGESARHMPPVLRGLMRLVLASALKDHEEQEAAVRDSGLDWTIVRPSGLSNKPGTGAWRSLEAAEEGHLGGTIPRADLAQLMLSLLDDDAAVGKAFSVSS